MHDFANVLCFAPVLAWAVWMAGMGLGEWREHRRARRKEMERKQEENTIQDRSLRILRLRGVELREREDGRWELKVDEFHTIRIDAVRLSAIVTLLKMVHNEQVSAEILNQTTTAPT